MGDNSCTYLPERHPAMSEMRLLTEASSSGPVLDNASHFAGAHDFVSYGGTYNNILGNYNFFRDVKDLVTDPDRSVKAIISGFPVLHRKDLHLEHEFYKGPGYRFYSAQSSGRAVALKVYEGGHAKERCSKAAGFYQDVIHPNIPHLTAVSPFASNYSFLVFDGEYEGTVDYLLGQILKKCLKQTLILGLQTVIGLSSGLDYLQDQKYPFKSIGLEHFLLLSSKGRVIISFDPEELGQLTRPNEQSSEDETDGDKDVLHIFNGLCTKTFDAARKVHYQNEQIQSTFFDDDEDYISYDDISENELKLNDTQDNFGAIQSAPKSASKPVLKRRPNGRRQELIWKPPAYDTIILNEISRDFQYFLSANRSSLEPALNHRRGRPTTRIPHRCPGYNRVEITLTPNITRSAIVTHSSPTLHEICPVCQEVVKDTEIFNCICANDSDESIPTVRCLKCFEWHHRPCVHYFDLDPQHNFVCGNCKQPLQPSKTTSHSEYWASTSLFEQTLSEADKTFYETFPTAIDAAHNQNLCDLPMSTDYSTSHDSVQSVDYKEVPDIKSNKDSVSTRTGARKDGIRGTKRGREDEGSSKKPEMKLNMPEVLKVLLVDDWQAVTKHNQLVTLPRSPNVVELLADFAEYIKTTKPPHLKEPALMIQTIVSGLQAYFDRALGPNLLYHFERAQYARVRHDYLTGPKVIIGTEKEMCLIYGAEHLLRMLASLPQMIARPSLDLESANILRDYVNELLAYMAKEKDRIFLREYKSTAIAHQNVSRS